MCIPFDRYKIVFKKDTRERLSAEELDKLQDIYDSGTLPNNLQGVLKYFLFACYTGLTWKDIVNLSYEDIEQKGYTFIIGKKRHKTGIHFTVPLIQKAKDLIDVREKEGRIFPDMLSNQKSNTYIQRIIKNSKIKKHISFHCARHSFATIAMNNGVPREIVQQMLGHSTEEQTRLYAKVLDKYIIEEMSKWDNSVNAVDFKENMNSALLKQYRKILTQIVATRITSGLSEGEIAKEIGVSIAEYSEIERGNVQLGLADTLVICEFLDVDFFEFSRL
jgi:integrase/recombinase XerD